MSPIEKEMYYIADPMCSWCWGFSPVVRQIHDKYKDKIKFTLVVGGLRPGGFQPMNEELKKTLSEHWKQVEQLTGQPFNYEFAVPERFVYNTEPSCRAAVAVRALKPEKALDYFAALHEAFYVGNRDVSHPDVLIQVAEEFGIDEDAFVEKYKEKSVMDEMEADFAFGQNLGVKGFPTVLLKDERGLALLTSGYQPLDALISNLDEWLDTAPPPEEDTEE